MARLRIKPPSAPAFSVELPVRVTDLNYGKHLGHMEVVGLMHEARVRFLEHLGMTELDAEGTNLLVVDLAVSYRAEAFCGDRLEVSIGVEPEGSRGLTMVYGLRRMSDDVVVAVGRTGVVFVDATTRRLVQAPKALRVCTEEVSL